MGETLRRLLFLATVSLLGMAITGPAHCSSDGGSPAPAPSSAVAAPTLASKTAEDGRIKRVALQAPPSDKAAAITTKLTPGEILYKRAGYDSRVDPVNWSVMISKAHHQLIVYFEGRLFTGYSAVFGRNLIPGRKEWSMDRRTPEGVYTIIRKEPSFRFHWFLRLNYPNLVDRQRYELLRAEHEVPAVDGHVLGVGSAIGIHGTDVPVLNHGLVNWTTGCVSVSNHSIDELARLLPVGTVVIISH